MVHDGSSFLVPGIFCFNNMGCGACSHAHDLNLEEGNVIGNFNGEFWGMFAGLQQAFVWAECTKYIAEPALGESGVGGAMAAYGAFDAIVIVTSGVLGILYPLLMAAALGIGDGIFNTQLNALLGMLFKHDMEGAFAQLKVWQCVLIAIVFFVSPYISLHAVLVVMLVAVCIYVGGFLFLTLMVEKAFSCAD
ncbi:unnamed protein product [Camellia sinensis]